MGGRRRVRALAFPPSQRPPPAPAPSHSPGWAHNLCSLSKLVNFAFSIPPLYAFMKTQARKTLITAAEKNGIPWTAEKEVLEASFPKESLLAEVRCFRPLTSSPTRPERPAAPRRRLRRRPAEPLRPVGAPLVPPPQVTNPAVTYPAYYLQQFHAYEEGNLNWEAAFEVEAATYGMAMRAWPAEVRPRVARSLSSSPRCLPRTCV